MSMTLPERVATVVALNPATDAAGRTSSYFSLKNVNRAWAVFNITQGAANTIALSLSQATAVAGTSAKAVSTSTRIWATENIATTPVPAAQTAASSYTTGAGTTNKCVVIEINPELLDVAGGFDCVALVTGASSASNITSALLLLDLKYPQATPPSPRVD